LIALVIFNLLTLVEVLKFVNQAFVSVLENMSKLEQENPLAKSHVAQFAAAAVSNSIISIAELASPLTSGFLYPLFLLCLQQLAKLKDNEWLVKAFRDSKVNLQNMLPGTAFLLKNSHCWFVIVTAAFDFLATGGIRFWGCLCMIIYGKFVSKIYYRPHLGISPNLQI